MSRSNMQVVQLDAPLQLEAIGVTAEYVGLGKLDGETGYSIFIQLAPVGAPEAARILHVSIENAHFLRESIQYALEQHRARTCENN